MNNTYTREQQTKRNKRYKKPRHPKDAPKYNTNYWKNTKKKNYRQY